MKHLTKSKRRRADREIENLLRQDGDRCSLCRTDFPHNSKTYGGVTAAGVAAVVGECCRPQLAWMLSFGLYAAVPHGLPAPKGSGKSYTTMQAAKAVENWQRYFAALDKVAQDTAKRAGLPHKLLAVNYADNPQKAADAAWFAANPTRSHRLRPCSTEELAKLVTEPARKDHELQMIVRQVEPGRRVKLAFHRNVDAPIPDSEPILHAIFDRCCAPKGTAGDNIGTVAELAASSRHPTMGKCSQ